MSQPPPLPAQKLRRVLRISQIDGTLLVVCCGLFVFITLMSADFVGAAVGTCGAVAGWTELQGRRRLKAGQDKGGLLLVGSQLGLLMLVTGYALYQYFHYDPMPLVDDFESRLREYLSSQGTEPPSLAELFEETPQAFAQRMRYLARLGYLSIIGLSFVFQGGLAYYYHRKTTLNAPRFRKS